MCVCVCVCARVRVCVYAQVEVCCFGTNPPYVYHSSTCHGTIIVLCHEYYGMLQFILILLVILVGKFGDDYGMI